jgi:DNA gyrase inhibitor GyrI
MPREKPLHVGIAQLSPVRVAHRLCILPRVSDRSRRGIRKTFQFLREWIVDFGLDPETLLHIGIPANDDDGLTTYDCCIEFPLPIEEEINGVTQKMLPGGKYAVLRIEKRAVEISRAIRRFHRDYIPGNKILIDEGRPIYEIYFKDTMEYCVPVLG